MDKYEYQPRISQSVKLLLMYTFVFPIVPAIVFGILSVLTNFPTGDPIRSSLSSLLTLLILILWIKRKNQLEIYNLFSFRTVSINYVIPMIFIVIGSAIVLSELDNFLRIFLPMNEFWLKIFSSLFDTKYGLWKTIVRIAIVAPIVEEILFRGILLKGFLKNYSVRKSIVVSALLFGIIHMNPWQFSGAFIHGIFYGWWFYKTRSLIPCILGHALNNSLSFIVTNLLGLEIPGYTGNYVDVSFQPIWFNMLGIILFATGLIWLIKEFKIRGCIPEN